MKKFVKMSLVAALAVSGLTATASAGSLEEAIKGVDISGKVRYRMEEISTGTEDQDVNIDVTVKVPVNDMVSFVANASFDNDNQEETVKTDDNTSAGLDEYYFQYANADVTANVGTFVIPGRQTDGLTGQGAAVLFNTGAFTVGAVSMYNNEVTSEMLNSVIAMGSVGPVALLGQYTDVDDVMKAYNVTADTTVGAVKVGLEYSEKELEDGTDELSTFKAYASAKMGIVSAKASYATTGDNGTGSIDEAAETPAEWLLWQLGTKDNADMDVLALDVSVPLSDKITLRAAYADGSVANVDVTETLGQISYKMSSNLSTYLRYSQLDDDANAEETNRARIEVQYSF